MVEAAGYQIALEAISNAYRHSGGDGANVRIGVDAQGTNLVIDVTDNGGGIAPDAPGGVGIESMKSRAAAVGGQVQVARLSRVALWFTPSYRLTRTAAETSAREDGRRWA